MSDASYMAGITRFLDNRYPVWGCDRGTDPYRVVGFISRVSLHSKDKQLLCPDPAYHMRDPLRTSLPIVCVRDPFPRSVPWRRTAPAVAALGWWAPTSPGLLIQPLRLPGQARAPPRTPRPLWHFASNYHDHALATKHLRPVVSDHSPRGSRPLASFFSRAMQIASYTKSAALKRANGD
jgi:hypothetical protein